MGTLRRIRNAFRRSQVPADIEEELRTNRDMAFESEQLEGNHHKVTQREIHHRFGNHLAIKQNAYEAEVFLLPEKLQRHALQAFRQLRRSPGFALLAIVTLALGIGTTTAILTLAYDVMLKPLPFRHPQQIVTIQEKVAEWSNLSLVLPVGNVGIVRSRQWRSCRRVLYL